jgi:hypothetical protein
VPRGGGDAARGLRHPLLIGGATTSRVHTAVKIHPLHARGQAVCVCGGSRAVGVVARAAVAQGGAAMSTPRARRYARSPTLMPRRGRQRRLPLAKARANAMRLVGPAIPAAADLPRLRVPLRRGVLVPYIDWSPFSRPGAARPLSRHTRRRGAGEPPGRSGTPRPCCSASWPTLVQPRGGDRHHGRPTRW